MNFAALHKLKYSLVLSCAHGIPPMIADGLVILLDMLAFVMVIYQLWGLWKIKRSLALQNSQELTTSLLEQGTLRFSLSTLLMCEFTMDLRRRNTKDFDPNQSALTLPTLSFQENPVQSIRSALGHLHESIIAEIGERNHSGGGHNLEEPNKVQDGDDCVTNLHTAANDLVQSC
ncbi:hypothetical protein Clacol_009751 [Clathrus columnatus]|uniref:Uncharacterized protein n=1 Tax=Clathrus columnatus TaxID=1419009 RepID=A0AAV5AR12_9AGAM|nr:hypothetical protein Clacol_009751 [Clathrus columnatus]